MSDFDELMGKKPKASRAKKAAKLYTRYDPDTLEQLRIPRDDDRYDDSLTPTQMRAEKKRREEDETGGDDFTTSFKKELGKSLGSQARAPFRTGKAGKAATKKITAKVGQILKGATKGAEVSPLTKVAPLAMRLGAVAAVIGATWWVARTLYERSLQKKAEAEIANTEARLKRPLTDQELAALLPQYKAWFRQQQEKKIAKVTSPPKVLR